MENSVILVPSGSDTVKENMRRSIFDRVGWWSTTDSASDNKIMIGDQIWFVAGRNEYDDDHNSLIKVGTVTYYVDRKRETVLHQFLSKVWDGDWSGRDIILFDVLELDLTDHLTYNEVCNMFGYKTLSYGQIRVTPSRLKK